MKGGGRTPVLHINLILVRTEGGVVDRGAFKSF